MSKSKNRPTAGYPLRKLIDGLTLSGDIRGDVTAFLTRHGCPQTAGHSARVAAAARRIAARFGVDATRAATAAWLHDVSAIFPAWERVEVARRLRVAVLPEEAAFPMIIHQKLSVVLAHELFGVTDEAVLSAIGCHTTLKARASRLDKVVFVADKIAWDQPGRPPYLDDLLVGLKKSLDEGVWVYLCYLWAQRESLKVVHPWFRAAYEESSRRR